MKDLKKIKLIILDCDGVLTDGKIIYDNHRVESKNFSTHDGLGAKILSYSDIKLSVVTGRSSKVVAQRCKDLNISLLYQNIQNKKETIKQILTKLDLKWDQVAYMGDDWNDWPAMELAYFKTCPQNAIDDIKARVDFVTSRSGGDGAVRELIDKILKEQGIYEETVQAFLNNLSI